MKWFKKKAESHRTETLDEYSLTPPLLIRPMFYYVDTILIHWQYDEELEITDVINIEEKGNLLTCTFDSLDDGGPERMINKFGVAERHSRRATFNTDLMIYWEITASQLKIDKDGE